MFRVVVRCGLAVHSHTILQCNKINKNDGGQAPKIFIWRGDTPMEIYSPRDIPSPIGSGIRVSARSRGDIPREVNISWIRPGSSPVQYYVVYCPIGL